MFLKSIYLAVIALLCITSQLWAADVKLTWDVVDGATGYKVYMSTDMGQTWTNGIDVGLGDPVSGVPTERQFIYPNVPEDAFIIFKGSAYNASIESIREWSGSWYDNRKKPLGTPGVGID